MLACIPHAKVGYRQAIHSKKARSPQEDRAFLAAVSHGEKLLASFSRTAGRRRGSGLTRLRASTPFIRAVGSARVPAADAGGGAAGRVALAAADAGKNAGDGVADACQQPARRRELVLRADD